MIPFPRLASARHAIYSLLSINEGLRKDLDGSAVRILGLEEEVAARREEIQELQWEIKELKSDLSMTRINARQVERTLRDDLAQCAQASLILRRVFEPAVSYEADDNLEEVG